MSSAPPSRSSLPAGFLLALAAVMAGAAWFIPARWRSVHPAVVAAAGRGTPGLVDLALVAAGQQRTGLARQLGGAAALLGLRRTNEVEAALSAMTSNRTVLPEVRLLGGPDPSVAALVPALADPVPGDPPTALEIFLPEARLRRFRSGLSESASPGVQAIVRTLDLPMQQFIPAGQAGGQPFEAMVVMTARLYERERLSPGLSAEIRELAEQAPTDAAARQRLEEFYLGLLSLSRRLDWTSLSELTRKVPSVADFGTFTDTLRNHPEEFSLLYAAALMSGEPAGVARQRDAKENLGRTGIAEALRQGAGSVRFLARESRPMRAGPACPEGLAQSVLRAPFVWTLVRTVLLVGAAGLTAAGLRSFSRTEIPETPGAPSPRSGSLLSWVLITALLGGFLILLSEPPFPRPRTPGKTGPFLNPTALTKSTSVANSSPSTRNHMEPTTLITMAVFGAIQLIVYGICVRKIGEITRLPAPASVRLRLLENEENLFDSGLYVGIGGTALALVMQVLQLVEANLLAAYSSNLMGIICVATVKIGHVRGARRRLILESQAASESAAPTSIPAPTPAPATVTASNPFTFQ